MKKAILLIPAMAVALTLSAAITFAADRTQGQEQIYGSQPMTRQERIEHRNKMRAAKSAEEREQARKEHHERMKARAKERGVTLPNKPPARGSGVGPSGGMCSGNDEMPGGSRPRGR